MGYLWDGVNGMELVWPDYACVEGEVNRVVMMGKDGGQRLRVVTEFGLKENRGCRS
jgi:hypothetical protein